MNRRIFALVAIATGLVLVAASAGAQVAKPSGPPIKIGGSLPLTGIYSETGKLIKEGYDFWVEDVNKRGGLLGRPVVMTIYDDESAADKAVTYYDRAMTVDKVDLISGGYPATSNVAVMPLVEKYQKVFVGMGGQMKSFDQGFTYSFASPPLMTDWVYLALQGIFNDLVPRSQWPKSMAILTMNNVIGLSGKGDLIKWAEKSGAKVVVDENYNLPLGDGTPLVSKAKGRGAELFIDRVVGLGLEPRDNAIDDVVGVGRLLGSARDDQRRARLVDQDRIDLVDDREVMLALDVILQAELHIVAQVVEAELVVLTVGDVAGVGLLALLVGEPVNDHADAQPQVLVDLPHPFGVAPGQIVVDRDHVDAAPGERVQHHRQGRDQGLALAGLHLGDLALVQHHPAD